MPKVSAKIGLTLKLFKEASFEFIRPEISIDEIDTSKPIQPQIDESIAALKLVWEATTEQMNTIIAEEMPQANAELEAQLAVKMKKMSDLIDSLNKKVTELSKGK